MMFLSIASEDNLKRFPGARTKIAELSASAFHDKCNTLPLSEEKVIILLFRSAMGMDNFVEEFIGK